MTNHTDDFTARCAQCGASLVRPDCDCWLCGASPTTSPTKVAVNPYASPASESMAENAHRLTSPVLIVAIVVILCSLFATAPGLGMFGAVVVVPVLLRTYLVVQKRTQAGKPVGTWQKVTLFVTSFFVAYVIMTVVTFATFGALCIGCLAAAVTNSDAAFVAALVGAGAVGLGVAVLMGYWVRNRYRRDIAQP